MNNSLTWFPSGKCWVEMDWSKFVCERQPNEMSFAERSTAHHDTTEAEIMIRWRRQQTNFLSAIVQREQMFRRYSGSGEFY